MDKERLEEIKARFEAVESLYNEPIKVTVTEEFKEDIAWLIEQAERVQELERANKQLKGNLSVYKGYYKNMIKINEGIVAENKRYREALEFYASGKHYRLSTMFPFTQKVITDDGEKARQALEQPK